ncbi:hypothetical protein [Bremerella sp. P1]|uniref:hypothetical protein n=1 Tax=Bremerella sp. P1 TaxID=3026424 RepID=UPI002368C908|nr:hypothetical protein [Bremerella sp. P1]WDI42945.1 hypothetical protein PSR63_03175 [Bremerella sp. P1]
MPERDLTSESVVPSSGKTWGLRFSLGAMMVIVALFAGVFGYLSYFRPAKCLVSYQVVTLPAQEVDRLGLEFHVIDDSSYRWALDPKDEIAELIRRQSRTEKPLYEKQMTVASWPRQADTYTYIRPAVISASTSPHPEFKSGEFAGFWGVRKVGGQLMFRVEAHTANRQPRIMTVDDQRLGRFDEVAGALAYEGEFPTSKLVFAAPMGDQHVHLIVVEAKEANASDPAVYRPGTTSSSEQQPELSTKPQDPQPEAVHNDE